MGFALSNKSTFIFRVEVKRPNADTGRWETIDFRAEFKRRSRPEIEEMVKKGLPSDAELLATEFVGWLDVKQPDGALLEVNDANRTALLAEPYVQPSLVRAWLEASITGPQKNS
jgi:hypothetical protein